MVLSWVSQVAGTMLNSSLHREGNNIMSQEQIAILPTLSIFSRVKRVLVQREQFVC